MKVKGLKKVPWWGHVNDTISFEPTGKHYRHRTKLIMSVIFFIVIFVEASFLFIQAGEIYSRKSAKDVSLSAFIVLLTASIFWMHYTIVFIGSIPVLVSSLLYAIGSVLIIAGIISYGDGDVLTTPPP